MHGPGNVKGTPNVNGSKETEGF